VNRPAGLVKLIPPGVVMVTFTVPAPVGEAAVIQVSEMTVKMMALLGPKVTAVAPEKLAPVMITPVPPAAGPELGQIAVTLNPVGTGPVK
jgi:hypothetical protein